MRIPAGIFGRYRQVYTKMYVEFISKTILEKKKKVGGNAVPNFQTIYKTTVIKIMGHWQRRKHIDQLIRIKNIETDWLKLPIIFWKRCKGNSMGFTICHIYLNKAVKKKQKNWCVLFTVFFLILGIWGMINAWSEAFGIHRNGKIFGTLQLFIQVSFSKCRCYMKNVLLLTPQCP